MPWKQPSSQTFIKRVVGLPGDRISIVNGHVIRNGKRESDSYIVQCDGDSACNFPQTITIPAGRLLHDGRQPARFRGQPLLGTGSESLDHRQGIPDLLAA